MTPADAPVPDCATAGVPGECAALLADVRADGLDLPVAVLADDWAEAEVLPAEDLTGSVPILAWSGPR